MLKRLILTMATVAAAITTAGEPMPELIGRWTNGRISSIQYRDAYTGVGRPPTGTYFAYEFRADGTYSFSGMMQSTMYNCTTTMFGEESGTWEMSGAQEVALHPRKNPFRSTNNCAPGATREGPGKLVERSYRVVIRAGAAGGKKLIELTSVADGAAQVFQREDQ